MRLRLHRLYCCPAASASARNIPGSRASRNRDCRRRYVLKGTTLEPRLGNPAASGLRDTDGHAECHRPAESRASMPSSTTSCRNWISARPVSSPTSADRRSRITPTSAERFEDSPIDARRDQYLVPEHQEGGISNSATIRTSSARVIEACRASDDQAGHREALTESDRHHVKTRAGASRPAAMPLRSSTR